MATGFWARIYSPCVGEDGVEPVRGKASSCVGDRWATGVGKGGSALALKATGDAAAVGGGGRNSGGRRWGPKQKRGEAAAKAVRRVGGSGRGGRRRRQGTKWPPLSLATRPGQRRSWAVAVGGDGRRRWRRSEAVGTTAGAAAVVGVGGRRKWERVLLGIGFHPTHILIWTVHVIGRFRLTCG